MRRRKLLYDGSLNSIWDRRNVRYTRPVFYEWRELIDFLNDIVVGRLKVEYEWCYPPLIAANEFPQSITEVLERYGKDDTIVYIDRLGEFKIEYETDNACVILALNVVDERFYGDVMSLGNLIEERLKYIY